MFNDNSRQQQKIAARIERVLIVDSQSQSARLLGDLLRADLACEVFNATSIDNAYAIASSHDPHLVFVEHPSAGIDGYALTRKIRRSELACRMVPVIMVTAEATAAAILTITMGIRQSLGLFISPLNTATGLGIVAISFAKFAAPSPCGPA